MILANVTHWSLFVVGGGAIGFVYAIMMFLAKGEEEL